MFKAIDDELNNILSKDPAANSKLEILLAYPGFHAIVLHRVAHFCWRKKLKLLARLIANYARFATAIEIHPGAIIGKCVFIDHGVGVVIGETAEVSDNVTIYHGVTLGGKISQRIKRHPTVKSNVVISAGAKIIGNIIIGRNCKIGANVVITKSLPANTLVLSANSRVVARGNREAHDYAI